MSYFITSANQPREWGFLYVQMRKWADPLEAFSYRFMGNPSDIIKKSFETIRFKEGIRMAKKRKPYKKKRASRQPLTLEQRDRLEEFVLEIKVKMYAEKLKAS